MLSAIASSTACTADIKIWYQNEVQTQLGAEMKWKMG
jgi:hypothetical protein